MSFSVVDYDQLELGSDKNPFDTIMSKLEKYLLENPNSSDYLGISEKILYLERKCQDYSDNNSLKSKVILQAVQATSILFEKNDHNYLLTLKENLDFITRMSSEITHNEVDEERLLISQIIESNKSSYHKNVTRKQILTSAFKGLISQFKQSGQESLEAWMVDLNFEVDKANAHKPLEFLHTLIEGLNFIDGVEVTLEDIKLGSLMAKLKFTFKSVTAKQEVKEVLDSTIKLAKGKLEKDFNESEKYNSEKNKIDTENELLKQYLQDKQSAEFAVIAKLQTESLRMDVERKNLENQKLKLDLYKNKKEILKEMLSDGIITQSNFEMLIKGITFLTYRDGELTIGENIDVIDSM